MPKMAEQTKGQDPWGRVNKCPYSWKSPLLSDFHFLRVHFNSSFVVVSFDFVLDFDLYFGIFYVARWGSSSLPSIQRSRLIKGVIAV